MPCTYCSLSLGFRTECLHSCEKKCVYYTRLPSMPQSQLNVHGKWLNVINKFSVQLILTDLNSWNVNKRNVLASRPYLVLNDEEKNVWNVFVLQQQQRNAQHTAPQILKPRRIKSNQYVYTVVIFKTETSPLRPHTFIYNITCT